MTSTRHRDGPADRPVVAGAATDSGGADPRTPSRRRSLARMSPAHADQVATWAGRALTLAAIVSLIGIPLRWWDGVDIATDLLGVFNIPADPSIFVICLVSALGGAVRRRFRGAHTTFLTIMALAVVNDVAELTTVIDQNISSHDDYFGWRNSTATSVLVLAIGLGVMITFWRARGAFVARLARRSIRVALTVIFCGLSLSFLVTFGLTTLFPRSLRGWGEKSAWAFRSTFGDRVTGNDPFFRGDLGHHWIYVVSGWLSAGALILGLLVLWRANRDNEFADADEELRVRRLLAEYGERDSLGYFATRRDKSVVFSPDGRAAVTFRVVGSVSVASADPVGDPDSWPGAVAAWLDNCRAHSLHAAVLAASASGSRVYRAAGLRVLEIGDEAIIHVEDFTLRGATMKPVRRAVNRLTAAGYTTEVRRHGELNPAELAEIADLAERWRGDETERGFSMALNRVGDTSDGRCVLITAVDSEGRIRGFLSFVPWGRRGLSLDLMRRDRNAENGINELMVAGVVEWSRQSGIRRISLNFAVFRSVFSDAERIGAGPMTRLADGVLGFASKFYQLETLYKSNDKYRPLWLPRMLCYAPSLTVMRAAVAVGVAEGFLPHVGPRFLVGAKTPTEQLARDDEFRCAVADLDRLPAKDSVPPTPRLTDQQRARHATLRRVEESGRQAYPVAVPRTIAVAEVCTQFAGLPADTHTDHRIDVVGRVRGVRDFGGLLFVDLHEDGADMQVLGQSDVLGGGELAAFRSSLDVGDLLSVGGTVMTTRTGELTVLADRWQLAAKCLRPLPAPGTTLGDDVRVRNRTLDLLVDHAAVTMLQRRSAGVAALRGCLQQRGFAEVETPMLQTVHGGAAARPFTTHINAYDIDLFLRIAPELFLKRLCVAGMSKIFELNRNFRNEGVDATHNPEFTSLEVYEAYGDYRSMQQLTHDLIVAMATAVNGAPVALRPGADGAVERVDLTGDWPVITVHDAVSRATGTTISSATPADEVAAVCARHHVAVTGDLPAGKLVMELYEALVEKQTTFPTFYYDFPVEVSPLARRHRDDPALTEQWDLVGWGAEMGTAYSELTDPVDQRRRLTEQSLAAANGDAEAMALDEDFLGALEYGMPPTGGLGLGVDRLVMTLTGVPIRPTLAFPFAKPIVETPRTQTP
ncbi:bifunctional lysylphosphatidylglycerol synthetase/lysine--tRNA ligase LysX [Williamsia sterculiae]|uniref:Lysine--tRNA ligase n=1 Tax=Williamsia sterculiae TaxID=1344003 RepID=A0A1N7CPC6_9NOCA|nr:bifunctional lysylphosphatidylglycerol synthetase/lysine--tRNA ligase LysX [Williamsia sterculiae]SIR65488.1 lysyl-tRNA synthetase, class II [Williamsia sterculiae]